MRVLSWNLYHGRDFPPDRPSSPPARGCSGAPERNATHAQVNRPLLPEFAHWLGRAIEWDVALLQEAPPRWYRPLVRRTRSSGAIALTSRNLLPRLQWRLADRNPDLIASSDGGSNQILVRSPGRIAEVRHLQLARRPERRRMVWARLELPGGRVCVANLHASAGLPDAAGAELELAAEAAVDWAAGDPLMLGGDLNLRPARNPAPFAAVRERFGLGEPTSPTAIDHLLARGMAVDGAPAPASGRGARGDRAGRTAHPALRSRARRRPIQRAIVLRTQSSSSGEEEGRHGGTTEHSEEERRHEAVRGRQRARPARRARHAPARRSRPRHGRARHEALRPARAARRADASSRRARARHRRPRRPRAGRARRRVGQDRGRAARSAAPEPDSPAGDDADHPRAHRAGAQRGSGERAGHGGRRTGNRVPARRARAHSRRTTC